VLPLELGADLQEHREVHARHDLHAELVDDPERDVARRAAEHIGENEDAVAAVHLLHGRAEARFDVVAGLLPPDRERDRRLDGADDLRRRLEEHLAEVSVADEDETDHPRPGE